MDFVQNISDILVLIFNKELGHYEPYGRRFVKSKIYAYLAYTATNKGGKSYYFWNSVVDITLKSLLYL